MQINDFNELPWESLAGSCILLRERVGNLPEDWHTADTAAFAGRSADAFAAYYGISARRKHVVGLTWRFVSPPSPKPPPGPFAEVRAILVDEVRYSDKPEPLKNAAEVWIGAIDEVHECGIAPHNEEALKEAHARFLRAAKDNPPVPVLPHSEIVAAFRLGWEA